MRDWIVGSLFRLETYVSPQGFLRFTLSGNRRTTGHETAPPSRKYTKVLTLHLYDIGNIHEITVQNIVFLVFFRDGSKNRFVYAASDETRKGETVQDAPLKAKP